MSVLRAAVIGASGIGKHHAKWLQACGCEVVAFAGSTAERVAATQQVLRDLIGFAGQGIVGAREMLQSVRPDLVAVCSPPPLHHEHVLAAAQAGCHVMCEKPLVWDPDLSATMLRTRAQEMVQAVADRQLVGAVNTQYAAAVPPYLELCEQLGEPVDLAGFRRFFMRMDSRGGRAGAAGEKIWVDLASHPLSVLMTLAGPGELVPDSACCSVTPTQVTATFCYRTTVGREIEARVEVGNVPEGPLVRRFGVDDRLADYEGRNDENGVFAAYLQRGGLEIKTTDLVQASIARFVDAVRRQGAPLATLSDGARNLGLQLALLQAARG